MSEQDQGEKYLAALEKKGRSLEGEEQKAFDEATQYFVSLEFIARKMCKRLKHLCPTDSVAAEYEQYINSWEDPRR